MSNWQKMLNGEIYNDFSKDLFDRRVRAKKLFKAYNVTGDKDKDRGGILAELLGRIGKDCLIEPPFRCEYGSNIEIGNNTYINFDCIILDCAKVTIGSRILIAPRVGIYPVNHGLDPEQRINGACVSKPIHIDDDVWIGGDTQILAGVTIGKGSVIGSGSVVTKDIPAGVIAVGNPCRVIRQITEADRVEYEKLED